MFRRSWVNFGQGGMGRGKGGEVIDIYFIIYFKCLHLCVVPSLNRNR